MKDDKVLLKIKVSHKDPEVEKKGADALKGFISAISEALGEKAEFYDSKEAVDTQSSQHKEREGVE